MRPKVQGLWIGTLTPVERLGIASFLNHGFSFDLYVYGDVGPVPRGTQLKDGNEILPAREIFTYSQAAGPGQGSVSAFSNFFRYKLLFDRGGIWVDTDNVCLRKFDVSEEYIFSSHRLPNGETKVAAGFIKAPSQSPIIRYCWDVCLGKNREALRWGETGPALLGEAISKFGAESFIQGPEVFCPIDWWDTEQQILGTARHAAITPRSCTVHLWNEIWRRENFDKHGVPPPGSTYEWLVQQNRNHRRGSFIARLVPAFFEKALKRRAA